MSILYMGIMVRGSKEEEKNMECRMEMTSLGFAISKIRARESKPDSPEHSTRIAGYHRKGGNILAVTC